MDTSNKVAADIQQDYVLSQDLANPDKGAKLVGFGSGTVDGVLVGKAPFGPFDKRVDGMQGPYIARPWSTIEPISIFIDPAVGNDSNPGTVSGPLKTITAAIQRIPQNIYHKVRIYLLDGNYGEECIRLLNYYVTPRASALRFVGHTAIYDGEHHPVYTDDNAAAVVIQGSEHLISGINGSEELTFTGITFKNGWSEVYDSYVTFHNCIMDGGQNVSGGYSSRHAFGGHYSHISSINCIFRNLAAIMSVTNGAIATFQNCTLEPLHTTSSSSVKGIPFSVSLGSKVITRGSPTLLNPGPNGKSIVSGGELIELSPYSNNGYAIIGRGSPGNDESLNLFSHNRSSSSGQGAGISMYAVNHPVNPGLLEMVFGGGNAQAKIRYASTSQSNPSKDVMTFHRDGEAKLDGAFYFGTLKKNLSELLVNDGDAVIYSDAGTGNVYTACIKGGVIKRVKLMDFTSADEI